MTQRLLKLLGLACGIALLANPAAPTYATNINISATQCQVTFAPSDTIVRTDFGVMTLGNVSVAQMVACSLPRSSLPAGATTGGFYVDGDNFNGATTSCAIFAFNTDGHLAQIQSFQTSDAHYDVFVSLLADRLIQLGHTTLRCLLPPNGNGVLRGVTSLQ